LKKIPTATHISNQGPNNLITKETPEICIATTCLN
jgi:hypothetical protein